MRLIVTQVSQAVKESAPRWESTTTIAVNAAQSALIKNSASQADVNQETENSSL